MIVVRVKSMNKWASLEDIYGALTELWHKAGPGEEERLGYLTSQDRRAWAEAYTKLEAVSENNKVSSATHLLNFIIPGEVN